MKYAPFVRIVATDGKAYPIVGTSLTPCGVSASENGAPVAPVAGPRLPEGADAPKSLTPAKPWGNQPICKGCNRGQWTSCICDPFYDEGEPDYEAERRVRESLRRIDWCKQSRGKPDGFERVEL